MIFIQLERSLFQGKRDTTKLKLYRPKYKICSLNPPFAVCRHPPRDWESITIQNVPFLFKPYICTSSEKMHFYYLKTVFIFDFCVKTQVSLFPRKSGHPDTLFQFSCQIVCQCISFYCYLAQFKNLGFLKFRFFDPRLYYCNFACNISVKFLFVMKRIERKSLVNFLDKFFW